MLARSLPLALVCSLGWAVAAAEGPVTEGWEGRLEMAPGVGLRLVLRLSRGAGGLTAVLDSPDQGAYGIAVDEVSLEGGVLRFSVKKIQGAYLGKLDAAGTSADGQWSQRGAHLPLQLSRKSGVAVPQRPQEPHPPLPYRAVEATVENPAAKVRLAGTLTLPASATPAPAVLLITGSGAEDRDETVFGHKPFLVLADALTRRGVAVLRLDDRGVGGSSGDTASSTSEDFAGDALAAVAWLKARPEVDGKRIGLVGHSEGALIAAMAANRSRDVAFAVLLAGPGLPGEEIVVEQGEAIARAAGVKDEQRFKLQAAEQRRLFKVLRSERDDKVAKKRLAAILAAGIVPFGAKPSAEATAAIEGQVQQLTSPWFRFFIDYDPRPALSKLTIPVLSLHGDKDLQVPVKDNVPAIRAALDKAGSKRAIVRTLPGLNHLLQTARTGLPMEYGSIEETMSPSALSAIGDFIAEVTAPRPR